MTEIQTETASRDYDRLWEIAHTSKDERSMAAASKLVDDILEPYRDTNQQPSLAARANMSIKLLGVYGVYPEAFQLLPGTEKRIDENSIYSILPELGKLGGLPLVVAETWGYRKVTIEELEKTAEIREEVAAALFDTPPNEAFMKDFGLTLLKSSTKNPIDLIAGKLDSVRYYEQEVKKQKRLTQDDWARYEANEGEDTTKLKTIVYKIENVSLELGHHPGGDEFTTKMEVVFNNPETTLRDLEELWKEGRSLIEAGFQARVEENQRAYDLVINGDAATYTPPISE